MQLLRTVCLSEETSPRTRGSESVPFSEASPMGGK